MPQASPGSKSVACTHHDAHSLRLGTTLARLVQMRALDPKANKAEKVKNAKGGHRMWTDVSELGEMIRAGTHTWEELDLDDVDVRLKWAGLFHRKKRAPGTFMMRLKVRVCWPGVRGPVLLSQRPSMQHPG